MSAAIQPGVYTAINNPIPTNETTNSNPRSSANNSALSNDFWNNSLAGVSRNYAANTSAVRANSALPDNFWNNSIADIIANNATSTSTAAAGSVDGLPAGLSPEAYEKAIDFGKLSSQAYDWDDYVAANAGMALFGGISDIKNTDFSTPNYTKIGSEGGWIDWWGQEGLDYTLFENNDTGDLVVAFKGTEPLSAVDWVEDAEQAFGQSEQYQQATDFARQLSAQVEQYNLENNLTGDAAKKLSFTGHSLGGGLATACALATGHEAIAYDAAGVSQGTIDALGLDVSNADKITNFNVKGDWLSDHNGMMDSSTLGSKLGGIVPETKQYGETFWLEGINDQADFGGWLVSDNTWVARQAESVLNHAWHVFVHQLENKNFV